MKHFLFLDPGFANIGIAVVAVTPESTEVRQMSVFETEKSDAKRKVLAADDNIRRASLIHAALSQLVSSYNISLICAESMSFPRNSSAAAKMAMAWGIIVAIAEQHNVSIVQASPQEIKKAVCGKKDASKEEIEAALKKRFPEATGTLPPRLAKSKANHAWDALAAGVTCMEGDLVKAIRKMMV